MNLTMGSINDSATPANASLSGGDVLVVAGTYTCSATTTCFACGTVGLRLRNQTTGVELATAPASLAPDGILATAAISNVTLTVQGASLLRLEHFCETDPTGGAPAIFGTGMALADYSTETKFTTLVCTRIF